MSLTNINLSKLSIFDSMIAISKIIREDFRLKYVMNELNDKVNEAKIYMSKELTKVCQLKKLLQLFYAHWKFGTACGIYKLSDTLWIDYVLENKQGAAVSLGIILLHIAQKLKIPLKPVIFPTQLILKIYWTENNETWFIDPFNGEILDNHTLEIWLKGNISPTAELYKDDLNESKSLLVIKNVLRNLKTALMEEEKIELALNVNKILLEISPNDPYEIRDRGLIYAQLECNHVALTDLIHFVESCPEDPISELIKIKIHAIKRKKVILH
ncbi:uncharacterized protein BUCNMO_139 [Buchnera aphidicola (Nipponaphis monzeni)]|uniref:Protein SirB1 N-terminal domain-containing protein n=2 Tax=Buchnera aphidicola TaxID=9 RepID=A0A455T9Z9_9GAMM|nr:uncharacterized protein BUCNMO_139 [Buchnera aphidicola (Nipponaphis monzeni)]